MGQDGSGVCEIRVRGRLAADWADWLGGMQVVGIAAGETLIVGPLPDDAALYGLLNTIRDLGLSLLGVTRCEPTLDVEQRRGGEAESHRRRG